MNKTVLPGRINGGAQAVASKSHLHRLLICAALNERQTIIRHGALCEDIFATCHCLGELGATVLCLPYGDTPVSSRIRQTPEIELITSRAPGEIVVRGIDNSIHEIAALFCGESGSTYRFLLPVASALGINANFHLEGRLPNRPVGELIAQMEAHGATVSGLGSQTVSIRGEMTGGNFTLPGNVSSQYISALLFAMPLTGEKCTLTVTGALESAAYVDLTLSVLQKFRVEIKRKGNLFICEAGQEYISPGIVQAEGDWSNAAFMLCAAAAGMGTARISGLQSDSLQGDKAVLDIIRLFGAKAEMQGDTACVQGAPLTACRVDIGPIPDLAPAISLMGAMAQGETVISNAARLRLKESDRIESTIGMLRSLGADAWCENDEIHIRGTGGKRLPGGEVDPLADHRWNLHVIKKLIVVKVLSSAERKTCRKIDMGMIGKQGRIWIH